MTAIKDILVDMRDEYLQDHDWPWIIGYSGGKDSTLVTHLVFEMLRKLPASDRKRMVHVVGNDTLVESPPVIKHLHASMRQIRKGAKKYDLPVVASITRPDLKQSFWVNLIGRGYATPNQTFRWCTDRMKISPTNTYIKKRIGEAGQTILLLGVRRSESRARAVSVSRYDNGARLNFHSTMPGCLVYRPILEMDADDVWEYLGEKRPPWDGSHLPLINLYRNALGGVCPVITEEEDIESCGSTSSRFGCWTCTVVQKDKSLKGFVESGFEEFAPLLEFRDWLSDVRIHGDRLVRRRNGRITFKDGVHIRGPFTLKTRQEILGRLLDLEEKVNMELISKKEKDIIYGIWEDDIALRLHEDDIADRMVAVYKDLTTKLSGVYTRVA